MDSYCDFNGRVVGKREQVMDFLKLWETEYDYDVKNEKATDPKERFVNYPDHKHFSEIFSFERYGTDEIEDGKIEVTFGGYCSSSLRICISEKGYYSWFYSENKDKKFECVENWAKENPEVEAVICSVETGIAVTERFIVKDGEVFNEVECYYEFVIETEEDLESIKETLDEGIYKTSIDLDSIEITEGTYITFYASNAEWLDIHENYVLMNLG